MSLIDWLIVIIPTAFVFGIGIYSRRYIRGVTDFLAAGRVAGRYVMNVGDVANSLAIITLLGFVESHYKTGFVLGFWYSIITPLGIVIALYGFCTYRFRETKALSLGQFLELRYNRAFRVFASGLRTVSEILANMIMPALAARFFIYYLDLPHYINIFGYQLSTFILIVFLCLTVAIAIICFGGTLALLITDSIQGMFMYPLLFIFIIFIFMKFSWTDEIVPVMMDRAAGESFLNPFDVENFRDFNLFSVVLIMFTTVIHRASWIGAGTSTAAKSAHEQKMASLLGSWRGSICNMFYVLIAITIIVVMNHKDFATNAAQIRESLTKHIAIELVNEDKRADFESRVGQQALQIHTIDKNKPLSQVSNNDTPVLNAAHEALKEYNGEAVGNGKFQQFKTLYHQLMAASSMRNLLPPVMIGLFALLMVLAMISTDDTRIFSASLTFTQDVLMPLRKKMFTPHQHIWVLRWCSIAVGVVFLFGSFYMSQMDYINLFVTLMCSMWLGGCGPVMIFGLYSRFGNTAGAFTSLIVGMVLAAAGIYLQRNWADVIYPILVTNGWNEPIGIFLETVSKPFHPYVTWKMDAVKFPINSYELYFLNMVTTLALYVGVSLLTQKKPFNLERMLHRGIYNTDGEKKTEIKLTWKNLYNIMIGITPDYTFGDKLIAWGLFIHSFVYGFCGCFVGVVCWNLFSPWPLEWWGINFFITVLVVPGIIAFASTFWFGIGGAIDLYRLFRDLKNRVVDNLDNGVVEGHVSLSEKEKIKELEHLQK